MSKQKQRTYARKPSAKEPAPYTGPLVVEFLPGAAQRGYLVELKPPYASRSIRALLEGALEEEPKNRKLKSLQNALKNEYTDDARVKVGREKVDSKKRLRDYLRKASKAKTKKGDVYRILQVRVTKPHKGGALYEFDF